MEIFIDCFFLFFALTLDIFVFIVIDLIENLPEKSNDIGKNATELMSLKFLEGLVTQGACANSVSSALSKTVRLDPSEDCKRVLGRILNEVLCSFSFYNSLYYTHWFSSTIISSKKCQY